MEIIISRKTEFDEGQCGKPFVGGNSFLPEGRDLSGLKRSVGHARDFVIFVGSRFPHLYLVENRSLFIKKIREFGCVLPERSIDRAVRSARGFMSNFMDTGRDSADSLEMDHRIVYGGRDE